MAGELEEEDDLDPQETEGEEEESEESEEGTEEEEGAEEGEESTEGEEEAEGEEDEEEAGKPKKESRGSRRISKLEKERDAERADKTRLQKLLETVIAGQGHAGTESERQKEAEKLALMTPEERNTYETKKATNTLQSQVNDLQFQIQDGQDRIAFQSKAASNPIYAKHADKVEYVLAEMRKKGTTAPREDLLAYVIGQSMLKKANSPENQQRKKNAAVRVKQAKGNTTTGRGDGGGKRSIKSLEQRLDGVAI